MAAGQAGLEVLYAAGGALLPPLLLCMLVLGVALWRGRGHKQDRIIHQNLARGVAKNLGQSATADLLPLCEQRCKDCAPSAHQSAKNPMHCETEDSVVAATTLYEMGPSCAAATHFMNEAVAPDELPSSGTPIEETLICFTLNSPSTAQSVSFHTACSLRRPSPADVRGLYARLAAIGAEALRRPLPVSAIERVEYKLRGRWIVATSSSTLSSLLQTDEMHVLVDERACDARRDGISACAYDLCTPGLDSRNNSTTPSGISSRHPPAPSSESGDSYRRKASAHSSPYPSQQATTGVLTGCPEDPEAREEGSETDEPVWLRIATITAANLQEHDSASSASTARPLIPPPVISRGDRPTPPPAPPPLAPLPPRVSHIKPGSSLDRVQSCKSIDADAGSSFEDLHAQEDNGHQTQSKLSRLRALEETSPALKWLASMGHVIARESQKDRSAALSRLP